jgi:hypothetical protein
VGSHRRASADRTDNRSRDRTGDRRELAPTTVSPDRTDVARAGAHSHRVRESRSSARTALRWRRRPRDARVARLRSGRLAVMPNALNLADPLCLLACLLARSGEPGGRHHRDSLPQYDRPPARLTRSSHDRTGERSRDRTDDRRELAPTNVRTIAPTSEAEIAPTWRAGAHSHCVRGIPLRRPDRAAMALMTA